MAAVMLLPCDEQLGSASIRLDEYAATQRYTATENGDSESIVLDTCAHGVLRWPARREYNQELQRELWQPSTTDDASATWEPVLDAADWEIAFVHAVGPEFIEAAYGQGTWADGASPPVRTMPSGFSHEL